MKGNNTLNMNQATMCDAIGLWLADQFKNPPRVISVRVDASVNGGTGFTVYLAGKDEKGAAKLPDFPDPRLRARQGQ
jgi:hypothetical protein